MQPVSISTASDEPSWVVEQDHKRREAEAAALLEKQRIKQQRRAEKVRLMGLTAPPVKRPKQSQVVVVRCVGH